MEMAERPPYVRFETRAVEDRNASIEAGHYVAKNVDFALITPPGTKDCVERPAEEWLLQNRDKARAGTLDPKWAESFDYAYKQWKLENAIPEMGTPIKGWPVLSPAQQVSCLAANVRTVEDLAALHENGLQRIGMGARDLQNKAKAWLSAAEDKGKIASENAALLAENESLRNEVDNLRRRLEALESQQEASPRRRKAANE